MANSNSGMQAKMAFERLMRNHYEHWDNRDIKAYSKTLAHDVQMTHEYGTPGQVKYNGRENVTTMVEKYRASVDTDEFDEFRHEIKSYKYANVTADRVQADVTMFCWQRVKATQEWKQQLQEVWPAKKLRAGRYTLNIVAELRNGEWLITKQDYLSESMSKSNSQMQAEMGFQKLMCTRYQNWDNGDIAAYSKSLAHDVEMAVPDVKYSGIKDVTSMVTKYRKALDTGDFEGFRHEIKSYKFLDVKADRVQAQVDMQLWQRVKATGEWRQQLLEVWPTKKLYSGRMTLNAVAELRNGEWVITKQEYSSQD